MARFLDHGWGLYEPQVQAKPCDGSGSDLRRWPARITPLGGSFSPPRSSWLVRILDFPACPRCQLRGPRTFVLNFSRRGPVGFSCMIRVLGPSARIQRHAPCIQAAAGRVDHVGTRSWELRQPPLGRQPLLAGADEHVRQIGSRAPLTCPRPPIFSGHPLQFQQQLGCVSDRPSEAV